MQEKKIQKTKQQQPKEVLRLEKVCFTLVETKEKDKTLKTESTVVTVKPLKEDGRIDMDALVKREGVKRAARNMDYEAGTRPDLWVRD